MECCFNRNPAQSLKWGKIPPRLLLMISRYGLSIFPKISDLGWHWRAAMYYCVSKILVFSEFTTDFWMTIHTLSPAKMQAFWQYKFYMDIHEGCTCSPFRISAFCICSNSILFYFIEMTMLLSASFTCLDACYCHGLRLPVFNKETTYLLT